MLLKLLARFRLSDHIFDTDYSYLLQQVLKNIYAITVLQNRQQINIATTVDGLTWQYKYFSQLFNCSRRTSLMRDITCNSKVTNLARVQSLTAYWHLNHSQKMKEYFQTERLRERFLWK